MGNQQKFWDRMAGRYARMAISDEAAYQARLERTRACLAPESRVLEIACGTGSMAVLLAPVVKAYLATDISGKMLEIAREKAKGLDNLEFAQARLEDLPMVREAYDAVLGFNILHLLAEREAVMAQVFQRLKPGGVFISSTRCLGRRAGLRAVLAAGRWAGLLPEIRFFSQSTLEREIGAAGFTIEDRWQPGPKSALFLIARKPL